MAAQCTVRLVSNVRTALLRRCPVRPTGPVRSVATTIVRRSEHVFNVQDNADFRARVINSQKPVLIDFHADWCGPCKLLGPRLENAVSSKKGKVLLAKVDVDELDELAAEYNIRSLPTVMAIKNGNETDRFIGLQEDDIIDAFIEKALH